MSTRSYPSRGSAESTPVADQPPTTRAAWRPWARAWRLVRAYPRPFSMLALLPVSLALDAYRDGLGDPLAVVVIGIGAAPPVRETVIALRQRRYALDYLALLAIAAALAALEFQVGAVIALMLASGRALEDYGVRRARSSLTLLADRIPRMALVVDDDEPGVPLPVEEITVGSRVLVRHGEVLPLDGELLSEQGMVDESSLTASRTCWRRCAVMSCGAGP